MSGTPIGAGPTRSTPGGPIGGETPPNNRPVVIRVPFRGLLVIHPLTGDRIRKAGCLHGVCSLFGLWRKSLRADGVISEGRSDDIFPWCGTAKMVDNTLNSLTAVLHVGGKDYQFPNICGPRKTNLRRSMRDIATDIAPDSGTLGRESWNFRSRGPGRLVLPQRAHRGVNRVGDQHRPLKHDGRKGRNALPACR
jgi:hypothetical protein